MACRQSDDDYDDNDDYDYDDDDDDDDEGHWSRSKQSFFRNKTNFWDN